MCITYRMGFLYRNGEIFSCVFQMPSTRSQGHTQPTLAFPRRKSCRVSSRSKTPHVTQPLACSPTKPDPQFLTQIRPLSPRRTAHRPTPLSPRQPAAPPPSPSLQPRLPLSPRKRTGEHLSGVTVLYFCMEFGNCAHSTCVCV